jgi:hypothetical protein
MRFQTLAAEPVMPHSVPVLGALGMGLMKTEDSPAPILKRGRAGWIYAFRKHWDYSKPSHSDYKVANYHDKTCGK